MVLIYRYWYFRTIFSSNPLKLYILLKNIVSHGKPKLCTHISMSILYPQGVEYCNNKLIETSFKVTPIVFQIEDFKIKRTYFIQNSYLILCQLFSSACVNASRLYMKING